jgi:hypothetical protein
MNTPETDNESTLKLALEVFTKLANTLKQERDEARTELEMWRDGNIIHLFHRDELEKTERERDEAREELATLCREKCRDQRERDEARQQLRIAVGLLSTHPQFANKHPEDVLAFVKEGAK